MTPDEEELMLASIREFSAGKKRVRNLSKCRVCRSPRAEESKRMCLSCLAKCRERSRKRQGYTGKSKSGRPKASK